MTVKVFLLDLKIVGRKRSKRLKCGRSVLHSFNNLPWNCYLIEFPSCKIKRIQLKKETEWNKANQYGSGFSFRQFLFTACWFGKVCDKDLIQGDFETKGSDIVFDWMGVMAYSKAIILDTEEDESCDNFSSSLRGRITRRLYNLSDQGFVYNSRLILIILTRRQTACFMSLRAPYTLG
jgi:hypothetical protein